MTDDVRIAVGLPTHPKTKKLKKRLGTDGCWSLICLFLWVGAHRWTGDLAGLSDEDIELAAEWHGMDGAFVEALVEVRFLDGKVDVRRIHDWHEHNPYAAGKGDRIKRSRLGGHAKAAKSRRIIGTETMPEACVEQASGIDGQRPPTPTPTPAPAPTPGPALTPPVHVMRQQADSLGFAVATSPGALIATLAGAGIAVSPTSPALMAAAGEGVTPEQLREWVELEPGKPADDILRTALRQVRELRAYHPALADALLTEGVYA